MGHIRATLVVTHHYYSILSCTGKTQEEAYNNALLIAPSAVVTSTTYKTVGRVRLISSSDNLEWQLYNGIERDGNYSDYNIITITSDTTLGMLLSSYTLKEVQHMSKLYYGL